MGRLRCGAPWLARAALARSQGVRSLGALRLGGDAAPDGSIGRPETMRACSNCVLLCTTRESARLWEKTGLFNLRLSSDAPNLQVENEETIEALSARTEALLDGIQQRFSFVHSQDAFPIAFADRCVHAFSHRPRIAPSSRVSSIPAKHVRCGRVRRAHFFFLRVFFLLFPRGIEGSRRRDRLRSSGGCVRPRESVFAAPAIEPADEPAMTTRFLAKASGDQ